jgi:hypothetical protein
MGAGPPVRGIDESHDGGEVFRPRCTGTQVLHIFPTHGSGLNVLLKEMALAISGRAILCSAFNYLHLQARSEEVGEMGVAVKGRPHPQDALDNYMTLMKAVAVTEVSATWLRLEVDSGRIRSLRDPQGRRLLWAPDVLQYAEARRQRKAQKPAKPAEANEESG